jgi:PAS domain S-box-containing protein
VIADHVAQGNEISHLLTHSGYRIEIVTDPAVFDSLCVTGSIPAAVILLVSLSDKTNQISRTLAALQAKAHNSVPVIFISVLQDYAARIAGYRAGATRYLTLPVDREQLLSMVAETAASVPAQAYRVMLVGDQPMQKEEQAQVLRNAGMEVRVVSDPLLVPGMLESFAAEMLVLTLCQDSELCFCPELAAVLRDEPKFAEIPVVFLISADGLQQRLHSFSNRIESYLNKLVLPEQLIATINKRARRYRQKQGQLKALYAAQYELGRQQQALDSHAIVSIADLHGTINYANDKFFQVSGYSREELLGQNHRIVKSGLHTQEFYKEMWDTIARGKIWHGEVCNRRKNGSYYWVDTSIVPFVDEDGLPYQYISIRTDISQVKENEQRLNRSQAFANVGTWDWDIRSGDVVWSERIASLFGLAGNNVAHTYENFLATVHPDDVQRVDEAVKDSLEHGGSYNIEHRCIWPDGSIHWLHQRGDVVRDAHGAPLHMLGLVQDITLRKQTEQDLLLARDAAEAASHAKSEFLASISHELRTPLNAILGFSQLFSMDEQLPQATRKNSLQIEQAGKHLLSLVNDLIDLSRIESNKLEFAVVPVKINEVIGDSLNMVKSMALDHGIQIIPGQCEAMNILVLADFKRLRQALINLLSNAIKYNKPDGRVHVACEAHEGKAHISITDSGAGIPPEKQARIFNAFDRLGAERGEIEGTGIGLLITKRIVEAMGGSIGFESTAGKGSTFWLEFPIAAKQVDAMTGEFKTPDKNSTGVQFAHANSSRAAVLYIEDNLMNLRLMQQIFAGKKEWELRSAIDAESGLDLARNSPPDLILMDINLPGMNGFKALAMLKEDPATASIPVIAVSANAMKGDYERGTSAGFADYVTKPLDILRLMEVLGQYLKKNR